MLTILDKAGEKSPSRNQRPRHIQRVTVHAVCVWSQDKHFSCSHTHAYAYTAGDVGPNASPNPNPHQPLTNPSPTPSAPNSPPPRPAPMPGAAPAGHRPRRLRGQAGVEVAQVGGAGALLPQDGGAQPRAPAAQPLPAVPPGAQEPLPAAELQHLPVRPRVDQGLPRQVEGKG